MSAQAERLFSSAKITLSDRRNRLGSNVLKVLEYLKSWLKIVDKEAEILKDLIDSIEGGIMSLEYVDRGDSDSDGDIFGV